MAVSWYLYSYCLRAVGAGSAVIPKYTTTETLLDHVGHSVTLPLSRASPRLWERWNRRFVRKELRKSLWSEIDCPVGVPRICRLLLVHLASHGR
jgi:hypothetical protein